MNENRVALVRNLNFGFRNASDFTKKAINLSKDLLLGLLVMSWILDLSESVDNTYPTIIIFNCATRISKFTNRRDDDSWRGVDRSNGEST